MSLKRMLSTLTGLFGRKKNEKVEKINAFRHVEPLPIIPAAPYQRGGARFGKHHLGRVYPGKRPNAPTAKVSFRPLGAPLSLRVRKGLRWGHMSLEKRLRTGLCATNRDGSPRNSDPFASTPKAD